MRRDDQRKRVCLACGKVKGEHRGWDVSCHVNSIDVEERRIVRGNDGRAVAIDMAGVEESRALEAEVDAA
jgi:hypothetical protein